jgi:hypothetical protein
VADRWQVIEQELSDDQTSAARRRRLAVTGVVAIPIAIGVLVSIVLYSVRVSPPLPPPLPTPSAVDTFVRDGQVLVMEPATTARVSVLPGEKIEVVLNTGVGQKVSALDPSVLEAVADPPCHVKLICGVKGATAWTFLARRQGTTQLHVIFGTGNCPQRASCPLVLQLLVPITVRLPA